MGLVSGKFLPNYSGIVTLAFTESSSVSRSVMESQAGISLDLGEHGPQS